jgi:hypothetical protein
VPGWDLYANGDEAMAVEAQRNALSASAVDLPGVGKAC